MPGSALKCLDFAPEACVIQTLSLILEPRCAGPSGVGAARANRQAGVRTGDAQVRAVPTPLVLPCWLCLTPCPTDNPLGSVPSYSLAIKQPVVPGQVQGLRRLLGMRCSYLSVAPVRCLKHEPGCMGQYI